MVPAFCVQTQPQTPRRQEFLEWSFAFLFAPDVIETQETFPLSPAPLSTFPSSAPTPTLFLHPASVFPFPAKAQAPPTLASFSLTQTPQFLPPPTYTHPSVSHTDTHQQSSY